MAGLRREVDPDQPPESIPALVSVLSQRATSPLNVTSTGQELGYGRTSFVTRLDRLVSTFAAHWCPHRGESGQPVAGSQSKLYLTDPILAWIPSRLRAGLAEPDMTILTEMAVGTALARAIDELDEGRWVSADTIGYARTGSGGEVDLAPIAVPAPAGPVSTVPIESKWVDDGWRREARSIEAKYNSGVVATKSILDLVHPAWAIPAPLVALLLG